MKVRVPATTANIGPGYDTQGMAFKLYNTFEFTLSKTLKDEIKDNLIYQSFSYLYEKNNLVPDFVDIQVEAEVPMARGLGSSATCIIAGLVAANEFSGLNLSREEILLYANELEGHPDNVAPALFGGHITAFCENGKVYYKKQSVSKNFKFHALIPDFELKTSQARAVVKKEINIADAVYNISRASLISSALRDGDVDLFIASASDRLHEPYRKTLINDYEYLKGLVTNLNAALLISGAGPTLLVVSDVENKNLDLKIKRIENTVSNWESLEFEVDNEGAIILP